MELNSQYGWKKILKEQLEWTDQNETDPNMTIFNSIYNTLFITHNNGAT